MTVPARVGVPHRYIIRSIHIHVHRLFVRLGLLCLDGDPLLRVTTLLGARQRPLLRPSPAEPLLQRNNLLLLLPHNLLRLFPQQNLVILRILHLPQPTLQPLNLPLLHIPRLYILHQLLLGPKPDLFQQRRNHRRTVLLLRPDLGRLPLDRLLPQHRGRLPFGPSRLQLRHLGPQPRLQPNHPLPQTVNHPLTLLQHPRLPPNRLLKTRHLPPQRPILRPSLPTHPLLHRHIPLQRPIDRPHRLQTILRPLQLNLHRRRHHRLLVTPHLRRRQLPPQQRYFHRLRLRLPLRIPPKPTHEHLRVLGHDAQLGSEEIHRLRVPPKAWTRTVRRETSF